MFEFLKSKGMDLFCEYVEIDGKKDFTSIITDAAQEFLKKAGVKEKEALL